VEFRIGIESSFVEEVERGQERGGGWGGPGLNTIEFGDCQKIEIKRGVEYANLTPTFQSSILMRKNLVINLYLHSYCECINLPRLQGPERQPSALLLIFRISAWPSFISSSQRIFT
jgi:hypothetical protein